MIISKDRGNEIYFNESDKTWYYKDTNIPVPENYKTRPCGNCGRNYTEEGHDGCLGTLIGLMNACCGHGNVEEAYVQFWDGEIVTGEDAKIIQDILKKYRTERTKEDDMEHLKFLKGYVKELENKLRKDKLNMTFKNWLDFITGRMQYRLDNETYPSILKLLKKKIK